MNAQQFCDMMNEALHLDINILHIFRTMTPCAPIIGKATDIELMAVDSNMAMASTLGIVNAMFENERVVLEYRNSKYLFKVMLK